MYLLAKSLKDKDHNIKLITPVDTEKVSDHGVHAKAIRGQATPSLIGTL